MMEEQIKKLIELAEEYVETFKEIAIYNKWKLLGKYDDPKIYFGDDIDTWSIEFAPCIQLNGYNKKIEMPWDTTYTKLEKVFDDSTKFLQDFKDTKIDFFKIEAEVERNNEIKHLQKRINDLKKQK